MISPLAYVDPSAKIGKNVTIHPFAFIDKNVVIGNDNEIMPNVRIESLTVLSSQPNRRTLITLVMLLLPA